jgi:hypothetical protein
VTWKLLFLCLFRFSPCRIVTSNLHTDAFHIYYCCCIILTVYIFVKHITSLSLFFLYVASHHHYAQDKHNFFFNHKRLHSKKKAEILNKNSKFLNILRRRILGECLKWNRVAHTSPRKLNSHFGFTDGRVSKNINLVYPQISRYLYQVSSKSVKFLANWRRTDTIRCTDICVCSAALPYVLFQLYITSKS